MNGQSFNQAFESIRSAIPDRCEAVVIYRRRQFFRAAPDSAPGEAVEERETSFAFHDDARTAQHFFDRVERLARQKLRDETAAVVYIRSDTLRRAWMVFDAFDLEQST